MVILTRLRSRTRVYWNTESALLHSYQPRNMILLLFIYSTTADPHPATNSFMDFVYFDWSNHPFIRGGYTSPTAHAYDLRHVLASSVEDRLFFAGEATSLRSCSTVPTAIETGVRAAEEVCSVTGLVPCAKL